jgi:hypothetical protein
MEAKVNLKEILETQDLGIVSIDNLVKTSDACVSNEDDLTDFIIKTYNKLDTNEEFEDYIRYSINELRKSLKVFQ